MHPIIIGVGPVFLAQDQKSFCARSMSRRAKCCTCAVDAQRPDRKREINMKSKYGWMMGAAALMALSAPAHAGSADGKIQVKLLGTAVLPDGKITKVLSNGVGVPAGTQAYANDNVVPTLAVEYFLSPNFSVETICCLTAHVSDASTPHGRGPLLSQ
jgi:hypothetical protein